jgi:hypothetical protein
MNLKKILILFATGSLVSACGCKASYMPENYIVKPEDKKLNCQEIIYAINETEFWMKNVNERCVQPHVFAKFFPCTPMVKLDAMRNEYTLSDRADYLRSLYKMKGCEHALKLKGTSVERQAKRIGDERQMMKDAKNALNVQKQSSEEIVISKTKVIADIPSNTK